MADFSTNILEFQQNGTYTYEFDSVGNLYFNSASADFSQVYLALPLTNVVYNNAKIEQFYVPEFEEFIPSAGLEISASINLDLQTQIDQLQAENATLNDQLNRLVDANNTSGSIEAQDQATKQVILQLRKTLGQGRVDANFTDTFPYLPLPKPIA